MRLFMIHLTLSLDLAFNQSKLISQRERARLVYSVLDLVTKSKLGI